VVSNDKNQLQGYDPATGRTLWTDTVPQAPQDSGVLTDGSTIYLSSVQASGAGDTMDQSQLLRIDAATGARLSPLRLPTKVNVDPGLADGNGFAQGLLLLDVVGGSSGTGGQSFSSTIAIDAATGHPAWTASGLVNPAQTGLFTREPSNGSLTSVDPVTGKNVWTVSAPDLGDLGGPDSVLALPGAMVGTSVATGQQTGGGVIVGLTPGSGKQAWTSQALPYPLLADVGQNVAFVTTCQPWSGLASELCADQELEAIAV
jgi:outer membrane protein assembly factor BamB